jgi:hypothetical protein
MRQVSVHHLTQLFLPALARDIFQGSNKPKLQCFDVNIITTLYLKLLLFKFDEKNLCY